MSTAGIVDVDALVVSWNSGSHLAATLAALPPEVRAIVIDNDSRDDSVAVARAYDAEVIGLPQNLGFPAAVNLGLARVTAPFTLLLNPDLVVGSNSIERCAQVLIDDPSVGVVGPATVMPDGRPEPPAARHDRRAWHIVVETLGLVHISRRFDRQMIHDRSSDRDVDAINGGFMLVRTDLLRNLGGLDESVFLYLEDADLCRRIRDAGYRVRFVATASAVHDAGASTRQGDEQAQARAYLHRIDADVEFLRRYGGRGEAGLAVAAFILRSVIGLVVSAARPKLRRRYQVSLVYSVRQIPGRHAAPAV